MSASSVAAQGLALSAKKLAQRPSYLGPVSGRTFIPEESGGSGNPQLCSQTHHQLTDNVFGQLMAIYPNWRASAGAGVLGGGTEILPGAASTGRCSVQYTDAKSGATVITRMYSVIDGTSTVSVADGGNWQFVANINALKGSTIYLRFWGNFPGANGMNWSQKQADYTNGDAFAFGTTVTDVTGTSTTITNSYAAGLSIFSPCAVLAQTTKRTFALIGDSRTTGLGDVPNDAYGLIGNTPRFLGPTVGYINLAIPGETAASFPLNSTRRRALAAYCSDLFISLGINDTIASGATAANTWALNAQTIAMVGKPALAMTLDPWVTNGTTNTVNNGTNDAQRIAYNTNLRTVPTPLRGIADPALYLESSSTPGTYSAGINMTIDGVHELNTTNASAAANSGFNRGLLV